VSAPERHPNPWAGATIIKLAIIRGGSPIAFFSARFPLIEATFVGCTLRRTKSGRLWCSPPKQRRLLSDRTTQYDDLIEWDDSGPASRFSEACIEAIQRHAPELLTPLLEGRDESGSQPSGLLRDPSRHATESAPFLIAPGWERDR
jgi:hypothetical protein